MIDDEEKVKLSIEGQIEDLKEKGVKFNLCTEDDAIKFLKNNTYYFKLKSYAKNYNNNNREHKYRDLDFAYLMELSKIDMHLRKLVLEMCLDIEHMLKTRLVHHCTVNESTDGFDVISKFLDNNYLVKNSIIQKAKVNSISSPLALKYFDKEHDDLKPIPLWVVVELISFGAFIDLYQFYYQEYHQWPEYSRYLGAIRYLRNASAHSNCVIYSLKKQEGFSKTGEIMNALSKAKNINSKTRINKMSIPVVHDFVTLLLVYNDLLNNPQNHRMKERTIKKVKDFFLDDDGRIKKNREYFSGNNGLKEVYEFVCSVII